MAIRKSNHHSKPNFIEKASNALDLPAYALAGLLHVDLIDNQELHVENHHGILCYGTEEIHISGGRRLLKVEGTGLNIRTMTEVELLITGEITSLSLE